MFVVSILRERVDARFGVACRNGFLHFNDGERTAELSFKIDGSREGTVVFVSFQGANWTKPRYAPITKMERLTMEERLTAWSLARGYVDIGFEPDKQEDRSAIQGCPEPG